MSPCLPAFALYALTAVVAEGIALAEPAGSASVEFWRNLPQVITAAGVIYSVWIAYKTREAIADTKNAVVGVQKTVNGTHTAVRAEAKEEADRRRDAEVQLATLSAEKTAAHAALGAERANAQQARLIAAAAALKIEDLERRLAAAIASPTSLVPEADRPCSP